jgi:small subunit ribosomal protein S20
VRKNKSAIKRAKQSEERRVRNSHVMSSMKTSVKKTLAALNENDPERLGQVFKSALAHINKAASKGVVHRNTASRKISRLSRKVHAATVKG